MDPFLKQVAEHYFAGGDIPRRCFIFPNRRSQVFFTKYLGDAVRREGVPIVAPKMLTINDFFGRISGKMTPDRVDLLLELYTCYSRLYKGKESLDEFIFWGDILLADFDDVDKYLVNPEQLYTNVKEFKDIQDSYSYLSETQRKAIGHFVDHFRSGGRLTVNLDSDNPNVKERFLQIWQILLPLYHDFRNALGAKGKAYEGMTYRSLAERMRTESAADILGKSFKGTEGFVFVGLNALNECEKTVMRRMRDSGLAEFCWDFSSSMVRDPRNSASFFMMRNVEEFPQAFSIDPGGLQTPQIEVISVPSSIGQTKLIPSVVRNDEYAVVLPDESLLIPLLNSIPPQIRDINVTMGYPMKSSAFFDFLILITAMQLHLRKKDGGWFFYHRQVWDVFSSGIFRKIVSGDAGAEARIRKIKSEMKYYIPQDDLSGIPVFDIIFRPVVKDQKAADPDQILDLENYQQEVIKGISSRLVNEPDMALELEFAKRTWTAVNLMKGNELCVQPLTYFRLLEQMLGPISVPFNGEPLKGMQIMGPLETRALDFKHIVILSCNEGVYPHRSVSSSFIPPELRKGFGLPTYEYQDAINAYYFYRLVQRAETVTLIYDSRTEGLKSGEESRYIKQLEYHFNLPVRRSFVKSEAKIHNDDAEIPKTSEDVSKLMGTTLSASALKNYLDCPAMFYFSKIAGLKEEEEVSEDLDAGMLGNIYHATMQALYMGEGAMLPEYDVSIRENNERFPNPLKIVTKEYVVSWIKRRNDIKRRVKSLIMSGLKSLEVSGRNLVLENVIVEYVLRTLKRDKELMENRGVDSFEVVGLEKKYEIEFDGFSFVGYIDRLDSFLPGQLRIVDYKTGKVVDSDVNIDDSSAENIVDLLYGEDNQKRPKIAFQIFLYDMMLLRSKEGRGRNIVNTIYQPARLFKEEVKDVPMCSGFNILVEEKLHGLLAEMKSTDSGWRRTEDRKTCSWCSFKMICGR